MELGTAWAIGSSSSVYQRGYRSAARARRRSPSDFSTPIAIVLHTSPQAPAILHDILSRSGPLRPISPQRATRLRAGEIYVAPPDFHLLVEPGRVQLAKGPRENRFRPAIDPLFRPAAQVYGPNAIGVILTGNLDDGSTKIEPSSCPSMSSWPSCFTGGG